MLRGYCDGKPIAEIAATARVSGKTIRATYRVLRAHLPIAIGAHPDRFGGAGLVLAHQEAAILIHATRISRVFRRHRRLHAPRLTCPDEELEHVHETIVRLLCALDLRELDMDDSDAIGALIASLTEVIPRLHPREPMQKLADFIPGAKPHAHPELRLYEDYRRYLLKNPLGTQWI